MRRVRSVTYQAEHSDLLVSSESEPWGQGYRAGALKTYLPFKSPTYLDRTYLS